MGYNKFGDMFMGSLSKNDFSSRVDSKLKSFVDDLNDVESAEELDDAVKSTSLLKSLLKKEGVQNSEFDKIISNISKKI